MKRATLISFASAVLIIGVTPVVAQVAGSTVLGVSVAELRDVMEGWSAKRQILGQPVYSDKQERIGPSMTSSSRLTRWCPTVLWVPAAFWVSTGVTSPSRSTSSS